MSAKEHDEHGEPQHSPLEHDDRGQLITARPQRSEDERPWPEEVPGEDNYAAAYAPDAPDAGSTRAATPEHGFWRTMAELDGTAKLQTERGNNEFPAAPEVSDPMSRRNFFQLMSASMALAGVGACRRYEKEEIVPLARRPEDQVPGTTRQYATAFELGGAGHAMLATSYEGRPIKLDGNSDHEFASSVTNGRRHAGAHTFSQAAILNLYDPDRSQGVINAKKGASIEDFRALLPALRGKLGAARVLSEATSSPTIAALRAWLLATYPGLAWHEYEPLSWDNERLGTKLAFGRAVRPLAKLDVCETIVTIDCDIFVEHPAAMRYSRDFAASRRVNGSLNFDASGHGKINRLWSVESTLSHTGAMADHRLGLRSEHGLPFAMALGAALGVGAPPNSEIRNEKKVQQFVAVLAEELAANKGRAVVIAGRRQPPEVHALVAQINQAIDAPGKTLEYLEYNEGSPELERVSHVAAIQSLARDMAGGKVGTLIILGGNPVYDAPADVEFAAALAKVGTSIHLSEHQNETSQAATWHLPRAHFLEAWGDARTWDGAAVLAQPLIAPLYGGLSSIELLGMLLGREAIERQLGKDVVARLVGDQAGELTGEQLVRATHKPPTDAAWRRNVHDGYVPNTRFGAAAVAPGNVPMPPLTPTQATGSTIANGKLEVVFHYSSFAYDGRYANNAWLQETPDFLSKVTWDNYAIVGPETAEALNVRNDSRITVKIGTRDVTLACYTMPGQARGSIALVLGGGRKAAGRVGNGVGVDTYRLRTAAGFDIAQAASVSATGEGYTLASVQEHWDIRTGIIPGVNTEGLQKRLPELVHMTTNQELNEDPTWKAAEGPALYWDDQNVDTGGPKRHLSLFREKEYKGHRWGMAIDLSTCTGCNACMVACQSENNVPVVGRKEVMNNREMHWIRIDRYFSGPPSDPIVVHQPVPCQQCENAPCEQVCPVGATVHSDEGLNDMTYNRCIGTRYCANNCPYKVRRFNFLDWNKEWREARNKVRRLLFNPEVTVRMRGVMEKCTFCVQRIQNAKIHARAQARSQHQGTVDEPLPDGTVRTACQEACPTEAIVFGDLSDPNSQVARLHADRRSYDLLPELYTRPRNKFLARVRNPNPKMEQGPAKQPSAGAAQGGHR
ncbi:MAG TPA: Fe-S-cluster-containing hydrogenase [Kofleriaceae bacterium]|nr:Fe-S-cluster-containing hydrogenase [Kofleriaceae bacterium]